MSLGERDAINFFPLARFDEHLAACATLRRSGLMRPDGNAAEGDVELELIGAVTDIVQF